VTSETVLSRDHRAYQAERGGTFGRRSGPLHAAVLKSRHSAQKAQRASPVRQAMTSRPN
jgi:hypothetical protein